MPFKHRHSHSAKNQQDNIFISRLQQPIELTESFARCRKLEVRGDRCYDRKQTVIVIC